MSSSNQCQSNPQVDCVVIGAGAAGLMCAGVAGQRGKSVVVLDHANKVGKKILMSGGGRCNFTNYYIEPDKYLSSNPHFCKSALSRYTQFDFLALVDGYQLAYHEKTQGQLFCDHKSQDILNILLTECEKGEVDIRTNTEILSIRKEESSQSRFFVSTTKGNWWATSVVVASGGLSVPTMGASDFGYKLAKQFNLHVTDLQASLVPFTLTGQLKQISSELSGVSLPVIISTQDRQFADQLLFTHRGISGPAVLQISNYWLPGQPITINFLPNMDLQEFLQQQKQTGVRKEVKNILSSLAPKKFIHLWLDFIGLQQDHFAQLSEADMQSIVRGFTEFTFTPGGTEGYRTAEVTRGGVDVNQISSKTFEAKNTPGLFFIGEVLDVTGWLGGYNFQWAWSSGYCAAQHV